MLKGEASVVNMDGWMEYYYNFLINRLIDKSILFFFDSALPEKEISLCYCYLLALLKWLFIWYFEVVVEINALVLYTTETA